MIPQGRSQLRGASMSPVISAGMAALVEEDERDVWRRWAGPEGPAMRPRRPRGDATASRVAPGSPVKTPVHRLCTDDLEERCTTGTIRPDQARSGTKGIREMRRG